MQVAFDQLSTRLYCGFIWVQLCSSREADGQIARHQSDSRICGQGLVRAHSSVHDVHTTPRIFFMRPKATKKKWRIERLNWLSLFRIRSIVGIEMQASTPQQQFVSCSESDLTSNHSIAIYE
eukprot:6303373-Amphidinium_carterae.1